MLKTTDASLFSPVLHLRRIVQRFFLIVILLLSLMTSCQEPGPAPDPFRNTTLSLEIPYASCTEAWLRVSLTGDDTLNTALPVVVKRDAATVLELLLSPPKYDTLVVNAGLDPSHNYSYKAYRRNLAGSALLDSSDAAAVTTLDTTSHDFSFETFTFGGEPGTGSSAFYDVAIIDENNIWAVGMIRTDEYDSTSNTNYTEYNAAHWEGERWELVRIPFIGPCALVQFPLIRAVFAFSAENIVFTNGGSIVLYDGDTFTLHCGILPLLNGAINAIWGSSPEDVWFVGSGGSIVYYDGSGFTRLESGTELNIFDIWGGYNAADDDWEILCVGSNFMSDQPFQRVILKIENQVVRELSSRPIGYTLNSVWYSPGSTYFVAGSGIWHKASLKADDWQLESLQGYYIRKIRGSSLNNIVAVGGYFEILHYNGLNWQRLDPGLPRTGNFKAISMKDELVVAVGLDSRFAYIWKGQKL